MPRIPTPDEPVSPEVGQQAGTFYPLDTMASDVADTYTDVDGVTHQPPGISNRPPGVLANLPKPEFYPPAAQPTLPPSSKQEATPSTVQTEPLSWWPGWTGKGKWWPKPFMKHKPVFTTPVVRNGARLNLNPSALTEGIINNPSYSYRSKQ